MAAVQTARFAVVLICITSFLPAALAAVPAAGGGYVPVYHPTLEIARAAGPIAIDGEVDDVGWAGAARAGNFAEHQPGDQVKPPVDTEVLVTYDDENLYVAFLCQDDPRQVRAVLGERDQGWGTDNVILALDTYGTQQWAYEIVANPLGVQGDLLWSVQGGEDTGYDLVFRTAGRLTTTGYQVEMAVPFASLRFPDRPEQTWRVDFWRNRPRAVRGQYSWAAYNRDEPCWPCQWGTLTGIRNVRPGKGLELLPAFTARQHSARTAGGLFQDDDVMGEASLGARYAPTSTLAAEATYNPDFSQVESDAAQIDVNTTFALSYAEKRPFFQEGTELFSTQFNVLYTRAINDPRFAAKFTGRPGRTNIAFLSAWDENTPLIVPFAEQSGFATPGRSLANVLRLRHSLGQESHLGVIASDRQYDDGGGNLVAGVDGRVRLGRNLSLAGQALLARATEPDGVALSLERPDSLFDGGHTVALDGERLDGHAYHGNLARAGRCWNLNLDYWERSPAFRADNGFEPRNDQRLGSVQTSYLWRFTSGLVEWVRPTAEVARQWNFAGVNKDEWAWVNVGTRLRWAQTQLALNRMVSGECFAGERFDGIDYWSLTVTGTPNRWVQYQIEADRGHRIARHDIVMGRQTELSAWAEFRPLDRLTLETQYDYAHSDAVDTGKKLFDGYVARARLGLQLSRELSTRLVTQYNDFSRAWDLDPLVTYRLSPFSIFYVGSTRDYAEFAATGHDCESWRLADRTYFLKLQYLLRP